MDAWMAAWLGAEGWQAVQLSVWVSAVATVISLPFAVAAALVLARGQSWAHQLLNGLVHLPLILPPVVTGYLLLILFGRQGVIGSFLEQTTGLVFGFRWTGAALASAVMAFPLMVRAIRLSIEAVDLRLHQAAATLGANAPLRFLVITLPMILPGVVAGAVLGFAKAMGEFGATITFVANIPGETQTIPAAIYALLAIPGGDAAAWRLVLISLGISMAALIASEWFARRAKAGAR